MTALSVGDQEYSASAGSKAVHLRRSTPPFDARTVPPFAGRATMIGIRRTIRAARAINFRNVAGSSMMCRHHARLRLVVPACRTADGAISADWSPRHDVESRCCH
jgi:hypothetical protein